ncbi:MAG: hypothetical protein IPK97_00235 [Ahniella sp.]|nr:hypothetical protein [Ahniella sp.]
MGDITVLLRAVHAGDKAAHDRLFARVYAEMKQVAAIQVARGQSAGLGETSLVHESYLRLVRGESWRAEDQAHFRSLVVRIMRQIAIDDARQAKADKRGGDFIRTTFSAADELSVDHDDQIDVLAVDSALNQLAALDTRLAELVELRFFVGMSIEEASVALGLSITTAKRDWRKARAFMLSKLKPETGA